jgi:hypothetical protein
LYATNAGEDALEHIGNFYNSIHIRLDWVKEFVQDMRSLGIRVRVHARFMLQDVRDIRNLRRISSGFSLRGRANALDIVVDCSSQQECHEEKFSRAKILAVRRPRSRWRFDDEEIKRCQAIAYGQSE